LSNPSVAFLAFHSSLTCLCLSCSRNTTGSHPLPRICIDKSRKGPYECACMPMCVRVCVRVCNGESRNPISKCLFRYAVTEFFPFPFTVKLDTPDKLVEPKSEFEMLRKSESFDLCLSIVEREYLYRICKNLHSRVDFFLGSFLVFRLRHYRVQHSTLYSLHLCI